jgi:large subunit ribosomal protein L30
MSSQETAEKKPEGKKIKITLTRSILGRPEKHRKVVTALGLKRTNHSVVHYVSPVIQGMVKKISYMLTVEEVS